MDGRQAEGLEPVAHVGAHRVPHQLLRDVFGPHNPAQVLAQLLHALAVVASPVRAPLEKPGSERLREEAHDLPARDVRGGGQPVTIQ